MTARSEFFELDYPARNCMRCSNGTVSLETGNPSVESVTLAVGDEIVVETLPVVIGELPENAALPGKRRPHASESGTEYTFELENSIPFGDEPVIARRMRVDDELLSVMLDLRMRASCKVSSISAGGLLFQAKDSSFTGIRFPLGDVPDADPESLPEGTVIYDREVPPSLFVLETKKSSVEFCPGDDRWRWISAKRFQGTGRFTLTKENNAIRFSWTLFRLNPGVEELPDGRNIRLTYLLSWKAKRAVRNKKYKFKSVFDVSSATFPPSSMRTDETGKKTGVCFGCQAAENVLKKWIRSQLADAGDGDVFGITGLRPGVCFDAAHPERAKAKTLIHGDIAALLDFRNWANRQFARKGASLELAAADDASFKGHLTFR